MDQFWIVLKDVVSRIGTFLFQDQVGQGIVVAAIIGCATIWWRNITVGRHGRREKRRIFRRAVVDVIPWPKRKSVLSLMSNENFVEEVLLPNHITMQDFAEKLGSLAGSKGSGLDIDMTKRIVDKLHREMLSAKFEPTCKQAEDWNAEKKRDGSASRRSGAVHGGEAQKRIIAIFNDWKAEHQQARHKAKQQVDAPWDDPHKMAKILLHSIQPAYYQDELKTLVLFAVEISESTEDISPTQELKDARRIAIAAAKFYEKVDPIRHEPNRSGLHEEIDSLQNPLETAESSDLFHWLDGIRLNFLGRAQYEMQKDLRDHAMRISNLKRISIPNLNNALDRFGQIQRAGVVGHYVDLWKGYVYRNLGSAFEVIAELETVKKDKERATDRSREHYVNALEKRNSAVDGFSHLLQNQTVSDQIRFERKLVELDIIRLGSTTEQDDVSTLTNTWNDLKRNRPKYPGIWEHALIHVQTTAEIVGHLAIAHDVDAVRDRRVLHFEPQTPKGKRIVLSLLTWNTRDVSRKALRALIDEAQLLRRLHQEPRLCIVDNGSNDGSREALSEELAACNALQIPHKLIANSENIGNSEARNQIVSYIRECGADYLLMIDGDIMVVPLSSFMMLLHMEKSGSKLGCLGADNTLQSPNEDEVTPYLGGLYDSMLREQKEIAWTQYGMFRRAVFDAGIRLPTDARFQGPGWGLEDVDLAFQMVDKGFQLQHFVGMKYLHQHLQSSIDCMARVPGVDGKAIFDSRKAWLIDKWKSNPRINRETLEKIDRQEFPRSNASPGQTNGQPSANDQAMRPPAIS
jgi:Glycosyl transferase family 2